MLGVTSYAVGSDVAQVYGLAKAQGAFVTQVIEGSAAARAGVKVGDIITSINGTPVKTPTDLRNALSVLRVGQKAELAVLRDGKLQHMNAVIAELPASPGPSPKPAPEH